MSAAVAQKLSVLPSFANWQVGKALRGLWAALLPAERWRLFAYAFLPTLSRFALLAGFGVTMKAIFAVGSETLPPDRLQLYGGAVLAVLLLAAAAQYTQQRALARLHYDLRRVGRRVVGGGLARFGPRLEGGEAPDAGRREAYLEAERDLAKAAGGVLVLVAELVAGFVLVSLILVAISLFLPLAGAVLAVVGVAVLGFLRLRVRRPREGTVGAAAAKRERRQALAQLLSGEGGGEALLRYEENELDRTAERRKLAEKRRESRIAVFSNVVSAFVLTLCLFLVAGSGLRGRDPVHLLLFIVALRLFAMQGRLLLKQWAEILRKKEPLYAFALLLTGRDGFARILRNRPTA